MRNHSHTSRNRAARDGADFFPPRKSERKAASSSIPSDWYDAKYCAAPMNERKQTNAIAIETRGRTLKTSGSDAIAPTTTIAVSIASLSLIQRIVGAIQYAFDGATRLARAR